MTRKRVLYGMAIAWMLVVMLGSPFPAFATYEVFVGYADNTRPTPFFPNPWSSSAGVAFFNGNPTGANPAAGSYDSGAIMIENTGATDMTLNSITVTVPSWSGAGIGTNVATIHNEWAAFTFPQLIHPGQVDIFTQNGNIAGNNEFDTSDPGIPGIGPSITNNCSTGPESTTATCTSMAPTIVVDVTGDTPTTFTDSAHVLDTGGFDGINATPCEVPGDSPGSCNESLQWRLVGTTGINVRAPEPSTLLLLGTGLVGLGGFAWRRNRS